MRGQGAQSRLCAGRPEAGFSLIEVLVANIVMAIAVLSFVHTIGAANKLNRATQERALATVTLGRFVERLRADLSWNDLYTRLRQRSTACDDDGCGLQSTVTFLVQVPVTDVDGVPSLVESVDAPRYGLPHDLNSDGEIDSKSRNVDYTALPIVARVRWSRPGEQAHEVVLATWLRKAR